MNVDALLDDLAERVAAKVLERLAAPTSHYGTRVGATLPPGKSRAWALRTLKTIPGARKVGRDWVVSAADFDAWAAEKDSEAQRNASRRNMPRKSLVDLRHSPSNDIDALAEQALQASGFRRARGAR